MDFSKWFGGASGYALHRPRPIRLTGCCLQAQPDGRQVWLPFQKKANRFPVLSTTVLPAADYTLHGKGCGIQSPILSVTTSQKKILTCEPFSESHSAPEKFTTAIQLGELLFPTKTFPVAPFSSAA